MFKPDSVEAAAVVNRMVSNLLTWCPTRGLPGSDLRTAVGDVIAHSQVMCQQNTIGPPLANCFELARLNGINLAQLATVRAGIEAETPVLLGAVLIKNVGTGFCLAIEARVLADTNFVSRDDVDKIKPVFNTAFNRFEEIAADDMDQMAFQAAVRLHAAVTFFLVETARPLPRLIGYRFAQTMPSLALANRLYYNAGRADELRAENHTVHPAFMQRMGKALSA